MRFLLSLSAASGILASMRFGVAPIRGGAAAGLALAALAGGVQAQTFDFIGSAPLTTVGTGLSDDGRSASVIVGSAAGGLWTRDGGLHRMTGEVGVPTIAMPWGISGDGRYVVGAGGTQNSLRAFRWSASGGYESLGTVGPWVQSFANDANHDGSVIVGRLQDRMAFTAQAFRWTQSGGMQALGYVSGDIWSESQAASADGNTVVGWSSGGQLNAFVWTTSTGMRALQRLDNEDCQAYGVSANGRIIVGTGGSLRQMVMWRDGVAMSLGSLPDSGGIARAVSDDGAVVGGQIRGVFQDQAGVWTADGGVRLLSDYLASFGVTLPSGWTLRDCTGVSADGRTFSGYAQDSSDRRMGFIATIPAPSAGLMLAAGLGWMGLTARRRR